MAPALERQLLELVGDIQALIELPELRNGMLDALVRTVPSDWASLNDIGPDPTQTVVINRPPLAPQWHALFAELAHENPLLSRWQQTRDGRAYRFSDVAREEELRQLELFRRVYAPLGVRHQIAFTLASPQERILAVALSRGDRDFSDYEREFLNRARPFLIQAYRNALSIEHLADAERGGIALLRREGLTARQAEVVMAIARGASNRDIAARLGISARTVQKHLELAFRHLGVSTRSRAADRVWALTHGRA